MNRWILPLLARPLLAASPPQRGLSLQVPPPASSSTLLPLPPTPPARVPTQTFDPAPLPNRDVDGPLAPRASGAPSVAPSLITRSDQYRGEGYSRGSTAQAEQERRLRPGAGFNLRMPFQGQ